MEREFGVLQAVWYMGDMEDGELEGEVIQEDGSEHPDTKRLKHEATQQQQPGGGWQAGREGKKMRKKRLKEEREAVRLLQAGGGKQPTSKREEQLVEGEAGGGGPQKPNFLDVYGDNVRGALVVL